jgi:hypothetical protein
MGICPQKYSKLDILQCQIFGKTSGVFTQKINKHFKKNAISMIPLQHFKKKCRV